MFKDKRIKWILIIAGIVVVVWAYSLINKNTVPVKVSKAVTGEIIPIVSVSGDIKGTTASLSSKMIGNIVWIGVSEGSPAAKGEVLAKLDSYDQSSREYNNAKALFDEGLSSKNDLEIARQKYESSCFISPINGIVTLVANKVGEALSPGMVFITVVDPSSAYGEVQIDESDIGDVHTGQEVDVSADAYPGEKFSGKLSNIVQAAELKKVGGRVKMDEEDKIFRAKVIIPDSQYKLKIGMTINADIITERKAGLLIVPREAVFTKNGTQEVFLIRNGRAKEVPVALGSKDPFNVEIKSGLKDGEQVAVTNIDKLKNGSLVRIER